MVVYKIHYRKKLNVSLSAMNHCINERNTAVAQWSERPLGGGKSVLFQGWVTIDT